MCRLIETIRVADGGLCHPDYHSARLNRSRTALFGAVEPIDLRAAVVPPANLPPEVARCRVTCGRSIEEVVFTTYRIRPVKSLSLVDGGGLDYAHKYADRSAIDRLLEGVDTDDILIVRGGFVTDTSAANIAFHDGSRWVTPSRPLLEGTTRARLIVEGIVVTREIRVADLASFSTAALMNAMVGFDLAHPVATADIAAS